MEATKTYKYTALSGPRIIRVLRLSGGSTDNLFAELVETNLDHACSYEAISYVWGSAEKSHTLNLRGGSPVKITESLYHALKDIRYSTIEDGPRYLWADGACINQEDIDERSQQVGLMAEIYGSALKVITYVGQDTLDVKKGMKLAETLVAAQKESRRSSANKSNAKHRIPGDTDPAWPVLRDFLGRTWYTRMWIIQESVLNENVIIVCGRVDIPWDLFLDLSNMLAQSAGNEYIQITPYDEKQIGALIWMSVLRNYYQKFPKRIPLLQLLIGSRVFNCSEPMDHVFALTSLMEESCRIKPDYKKTTRCVYIEAAEKIRKSSGLEILSYAGILKIQKVPSWVPDWSFHPDQTPILTSRWFNSLWFLFDGLLFYVMRHIYVPADLKTGQLRLSGCVFDRVVHVGGTLRRCFITARLERYKWAQEQYSQLLTRSGTKYVGGGASLEAFWRTLILDLDPEKRMQHHNALRTSGASFESYVRPNKLWARKEALESIEDYNPNKRPKPPAIESVVMEAWKRESMLDPTACDKDEGEYNVFRSLRQKDSQQGSSSQGLEYRDLVLKAQNLYRAFFMTEKGYIGMSAQGVELDDVVTFLPGARVPFLLRRKKECSTYSLVGDCYIHGMMNGEVLRDGHWNVSPIILV